MIFRCLFRGRYLATRFLPATTYCHALCPCGINRTSFTSDTNLSRVLMSVTGNKRNSLEDVGFTGRHLYNYSYSHHNHWSGRSSPLVALVLLSWSPAC
jgi:hypothetical protein